MVEYQENSVFSLSQLTALIAEWLDSLSVQGFWVVAEIAEIRRNRNGHCYLELVEKEEDILRAKMDGIIWSSNYQEVVTSFEEVTGESLKVGWKILFWGRLRFHPIYGLSLEIKKIDPNFSLGEMMRKRQEVLARLEGEGLLDLNQLLPVSPVFQKIAVISSPTAAGWEDFTTHLVQNPFGYKFFWQFYPAYLQGEEAETSIKEALAAIEKEKEAFDCVVIVRGGGSRVDLSCFDGYNLARDIALFPLPVITGIGHQRDKAVADYVAYQSLKTPTAVAEFLINRARDFELKIEESSKIIERRARDILEIEEALLNNWFNRFIHLVRESTKEEEGKLLRLEDRWATFSSLLIREEKKKIDNLWSKMCQETKNLIKDQELKLANQIRTVRILDPTNVLKRGYSLTFQNGQLIKRVENLQKESSILTQFFDGWVKSEVQEVQWKNQKTKS